MDSDDEIDFNIYDFDKICDDLIKTVGKEENADSERVFRLFLNVLANADDLKPTVKQFKKIKIILEENKAFLFHPLMKFDGFLTTYEPIERNIFFKHYLLHMVKHYPTSESFAVAFEMLRTNLKNITNTTAKCIFLDLIEFITDDFQNYKKAVRQNKATKFSEMGFLFSLLLFKKYIGIEVMELYKNAIVEYFKNQFYQAIENKTLSLTIKHTKSNQKLKESDITTVIIGDSKLDIENSLYQDLIETLLHLFKGTKFEEAYRIVVISLFKFQQSKNEDKIYQSIYNKGKISNDSSNSSSNSNSSNNRSNSSSGGDNRFDFIITPLVSENQFDSVKFKLFIDQFNKYQVSNNNNNNRELLKDSFIQLISNLEKFSIVIEIVNSFIELIDVGDKQKAVENKVLLFKDLGNKYFLMGDFNFALLAYTESLRLVSGSDINTIKIIYSNKSITNIKLLNYLQAEIDANKSIDLDEHFIKAIFRRGLARVGLKKYDLAARDFKLILSIEPGNETAKSELTKLISKPKRNNSDNNNNNKRKK